VQIAHLADVVESGKPIPGYTPYGSGTVGDPYLYTGQGSTDQTEFYRQYKKFEEVGLNRPGIAGD